jgi:predicted DCC family thiol-disulfide oxidoreductase YuxK
VSEPAVILFDGVCNFCNSSVQFVIKRDPKRYFRYAPLQSAYGQAELARYGLPVESFGSFVLVEDGKAYTRSTASLRVARKLSGAWPVLYAFIIVPAFLRNMVYEFIAQNRYRWFGKRAQCMIPNAEQRALFLS